MSERISFSSFAIPAFSFVIPAKAGIQARGFRRLPWIPAFAGMTVEGAFRERSSA